MTTTDVKSEPTVAKTVLLSDDVQDILHLAKKQSKVAHQADLQDAHILKALADSSRLFTLQDALLKACGCSAAKIAKTMKQIQQAFPQITGSVGDVVPRAKQIAEASQPAAGRPKVGVEHLLLALLQSSDSLVKATLSQVDLNAEKVEAVLPKVVQGSATRLVLYGIRETLEVVVMVLVLVIAIKQGIGEFRLIPSESMVPSLQIGDRIVVEKVTGWMQRKPQRGDILVFYPPEAILRQDPLSILLRATGFSGFLFDKESRIDTAFIKRVIGTPGDTIDVRPGVGVLVNGQLIDEPYVNEIANTCTFINYCGEIKVPPKMYYMMGDNRNHSADSRYWQFLAQDRIIGRAVYRFWPLGSRFGEISPRPTTPPKP